jgi:transposase
MNAKPRPVGRPTAYRPEYVEQLETFCAEGYSLTAFAGEIGVDRDTITEWAKVHPEFSLAVKRAKAARARWWEERAREIAEKGGSGGQSTMVIFGLKNHAPEDYREKQEIEHSGSVGFAERLVAARARAQQTE